MPKKTPKLCPLAQHIVKMLAESGRPGHGPSYATGKAHELDGLSTTDVLARAVRNLDSRNQGELIDVIMRASGRDIGAGDLAAAARVIRAISALPTIDLVEMLL
ncbi:hypothetical protein [Variovorax guangxiensis]|uniref:Uncharacterized protein n=1 Tax=Variovorax guangxiensis TaxID=1775474 RepID=A0A840G3Z9_9BURK|nr:hypothetical protein [Variovorax guangxiensis]MBB4225997.1 hypothetical protein [Variovorax guangxiensis]